MDFSSLQHLLILIQAVPMFLAWMWHTFVLVMDAWWWCPSLRRSSMNTENQYDVQQTDCSCSMRLCKWHLVWPPLAFVHHITWILHLFTEWFVSPCKHSQLFNLKHILPYVPHMHSAAKKNTRTSLCLTRYTAHQIQRTQDNSLTPSSGNSCSAEGRKTHSFEQNIWNRCPLSGPAEFCSQLHHPNWIQGIQRYSMSGAEPYLNQALHSALTP